MPITFYGNPVLRAKSIPVVDFNEDLRTLAEAMIETMHQARGIGLAAQQIGEQRAVFVLDVPEELDVDEDGKRLNPDIPMPLILVNPVIEPEGRETWMYEEGCLSFPEITGKVERPWAAVIHFQDLDGNKHQLRAEGLVARAAMHELDHLNGVLFIDHLSSAKRLALGGKLKRLKATTQATLRKK